MDIGAVQVRLSAIPEEHRDAAMKAVDVALSYVDDSLRLKERDADRREDRLEDPGEDAQEEEISEFMIDRAETQAKSFAFGKARQVVHEMQGLAEQNLKEQA